MSDRGRNGQTGVYRFPYSRVAPWFSVKELANQIEAAGGAMQNLLDENGLPTENIRVMLPRDHTADYDLIEILKFGEGSVANVPMATTRTE